MLRVRHWGVVGDSRHASQSLVISFDLPRSPVRPTYSLPFISSDFVFLEYF